MHFGLGFSSGSSDLTLYEIIQSLRETSDLEICYDFAAKGTYSGSGQIVTDLVNGRTMTLGDTSSSAGDDPSFTGTAGGLSLSEYFLMGNNDTMKAEAGQTWTNNFHKNTSANTWTVLALVELQSSSTSFSVFTTGPSPGMDFAIWANGGTQRRPGVWFYTGTGSNAVVLQAPNFGSTLQVPTNKVCLVGASWDRDDNPGGLFRTHLFLDDDVLSVSNVGSNPLSNNTEDYQGGSVRSFNNSNRIHALMVWGRKVDNAMPASLYNALVTEERVE